RRAARLALSLQPRPVWARLLAAGRPTGGVGREPVAPGARDQHGARPGRYPVAAECGGGGELARARSECHFAGAEIGAAGGAGGNGGRAVPARAGGGHALVEVQPAAGGVAGMDPPAAVRSGGDARGAVGSCRSVAASAMALRVALTPPLATYYFAAAALVLTVALVENSYALAYHDELTGIPGRRAFNEAVGELAEPYAIAMVDVDHFKKFNDTYGHDIGDQVLRMVAGRLARVTGGGRAYRCGGEEFAVVFPGKAVEEALPHLETLRQAIEQTEFMVRGPDRSRRRRPERRQQGPQRRAKS